MTKAVVILSGGLDSTTTLYKAMKENDEVIAISFNYGQKHVKELECAKFVCASNKIKHDIIDISQLQSFLKSSLTNNDEIPEGHYEAENMKSTVVPNRNMLFISIAAGYALSIDAQYLYLGVHAGDHEIYPDCRIEFIEAAEKAINIGNYGNLKILVPYVDIDKAGIVKEGIEMNVPYGMTWTCYKGGEKPCGKCGSCQERLEAFKNNNMEDPLEYE